MSLRVFLMPMVCAVLFCGRWGRARSEELGGRRAFVSDYEVYGARAADSKQSQVEIHIGLKPGP